MRGTAPTASQAEAERAREWLELALATFDELGTPLWAGKARAELTGAARYIAPAGDGLTPRERRIASSSLKGRRTRRSRRPSSSRSARLSSTLTQIYRKLDIRSRTQLARKLDDSR